jgi:fructosamine-3-kinase
MNNIHKICEANGMHLINSTSVSGGDINRAYSIRTDKGSFFLKVNSSVKYPHMFAKEAEGLRALQQAHSLKIPEVVATGEFEDQQYLVLELLEKASASDNFWNIFAKGLSSLHRITHESFGWHTSNFIGSLKQNNNMHLTWEEFYKTQRIIPLVKKLFDNGDLSKADVGNAEKLCNRIDQIFPDEPPALLHGDLWAGNFMAVKSTNSVTGVAPSIYDPAVYYGHREMDIGMTLLFGGFDTSFYSAYNSFYPLEKEWRKRVPLTQLYPLLVHAILFGGGYVAKCKDLLLNWV